MHQEKVTNCKFVLSLVPKVTPKDFQIVEDSINATSAIFTWEGVSEEPEIMQGHLTAYDVCIFLFSKCKYFLSEQCTNLFVRSASPQYFNHFLVTGRLFFGRLMIRRTDESTQCR